MTETKSLKTLEAVRFHSEDLESDINLRNKIFNYSRRASLEATKDAAENMSVDNWEQRPGTLLHTLLIEKRFARDRGCFYALNDPSTQSWVANSGVYRSDIDPAVFIGGVRAWTMPGYRSQYLHGENIFPLQIEWARQRGGKLFLLTFNDYNKKLAEIFIRGGKQRKATGFGVSCSSFYHDIALHPKMVWIKGTRQWIIKKYLCADFTYDFSSLEAADA